MSLRILRGVTGRTTLAAGLAFVGIVLGSVGLVATSPAHAGALPAVVPSPAPDQSVITVAVGGDRTATRTVAPLAGATLGLFSTAAAAEPVDPDWGVCVSDADGDCSFVVPDTAPGGTNAGSRFWVRQIATPTGWFMNPSLRTGPGSGSGSVDSAYAFESPALAGGATYRSTSDFMFGSAGSGTPLTSSEGVWQQSRTNPSLPAQCGLDVALVLDLSASVSSSELVQLKAAADTFTDALVGTPSRMAVFSFDGSSPSSSVGANVPDLANVSTQSAADEFKSVYANWTTGSGTNWDRGIWAVAQAAPHYEVAVVITDGNPTRFSADPVLGSGGTTHFRDVENGIYSANAVKADGTRLIAVGVGDGVDDVTRLNLRALSGLTLFDGSNILEADYLDAVDYAEAGEALSDLVLSQCAGSVSVFKQIVPAGNDGDDIAGAAPAGAGWQFTASTDSSGATVDPQTATTTGDGTGGVSFEVGYPAGVPDAAVTITEAQQPGYTMVSPDGKNAVCVNPSTGEPVALANVDDAASPGFVVDIPATAHVACTMYNRPSAGIVVDKTWVIDGQAYAEGTQPAGFEAEAELTGPGDAGPDPQPWGAAREGYDVDEAVVVDETAIMPTGCTLERAAVTAVDGAPADAVLPFTTTAGLPFRQVVVTNTVACPTFLSLAKVVVNDDGGSAEASDFELAAGGPTPVAGPGGSAEVTDRPVAPGVYTLSESGPGGYDPRGWSCVDQAGMPVEVDDDTVALTPGTSTTCTVTNDDAPSATPGPEPAQPPGAGALPNTGFPGAGLIPIAVVLAAAGLVLSASSRAKRARGTGQRMSC